jgi:hypothetical protein
MTGHGIGRADAATRAGMRLASKEQKKAVVNSVDEKSVLMYVA